MPKFRSIMHFGINKTRKKINVKVWYHFFHYKIYSKLLLLIIFLIHVLWLGTPSWAYGKQHKLCVDTLCSLGTCQGRFIYLFETSRGFLSRVGPTDSYSHRSAQRWLCIYLFATIRVHFWICIEPMKQNQRIVQPMEPKKCDYQNWHLTIMWGACGKVYCFIHIHVDR